MSIHYSSGTTETPYIYAQINLAIYVLKKDRFKSLEILDALEYHVDKTTVPMTKQFYWINRCLVEYANGIKNYELIKKIREKPFRGDIKYVSSLYNNYKYRFDNDIKYQEEDWYELHCPGYLFYRYFDIRKLCMK